MQATPCIFAVLLSCKETEEFQSVKASQSSRKEGLVATLTNLFADKSPNQFTPSCIILHWKLYTLAVAGTDTSKVNVFNSPGAIVSPSFSSMRFEPHFVLSCLFWLPNWKPPAKVQFVFPVFWKVILTLTLVPGFITVGTSCEMNFALFMVGLMGMLELRAISPRSILAPSAVSRRYQSLGMSYPSISSVTKAVSTGVWSTFSASLYMAVPSSTSSNMAT